MAGSGSAHSPEDTAVVLVRAVAVLAAALAGATGVLALLRGAVSQVAAQLDSPGGWSALPLDLVIVALAAAAVAGCGLWLVAVTVATVVEAVTGVSSAVLRAVSPRVVRRIVLMCCGIAVGGASLLPPATATEHGRPAQSAAQSRGRASLAGLPLPDRALGEAPPAAHEERARPAPGAPTHLVTVAAVERGGQTYVVRQGDSLWGIAARFLPDADAARIDAAWREIHRANREVVGPDPDLIIPGTTLRIPPRTAAAHPHRKDAS